MEALLPLILFLGLPLLILFFFKANVGIMFLAACSGLVLLGNLDPVVVTTAGSIVPGEGEAYVRLAVVLVTMMFAGLIFRGTISGVHTLLHGLIALLLALVLWLTLPEATGMSWLSTTATNQYWQDLDAFRALIISAGFGLSLLAVLFGHKKHHKKHGH